MDRANAGLSPRSLRQPCRSTRGFGWRRCPASGALLQAFRAPVDECCGVPWPRARTPRALPTQRGTSPLFEWRRRTVARASIARVPWAATAPPNCLAGVDSIPATLAWVFHTSGISSAARSMSRPGSSARCTSSRHAAVVGKVYGCGATISNSLNAVVAWGNSMSCAD